MNLDLDYKLRLISEKTLIETTPQSDADFDSTYDVAFHLNDWNGVHEIVHELDPITYHPEVVAQVSTEDIAEIEDELRSWLESRSADGSLLVKLNMVYDVAFQSTPKGIKFRRLEGVSHAS